MQRAHKDALYEQLARIGKAVASSHRLELLDLLGQAPRTVEALAAQAGMSIANTSQHLQVLRAAGLVEAEKSGLYVTYRLASSEVTTFTLGLRRLAEERLAELERVKKQFFTTGDELEGLDGTELLRLARRGQVVVLDVRPAEEYAAGHIAGALSIPHDELERRLSELPKSRKIVAYCRGPYCVFAIEAVKVLRARGYRAVRMAEGIDEWRALGLAVQRGGAA